MKTISSQWQDAILVCRKCSKKLGGGFGPDGKTPLAKALRQHWGLKKGRKAARGIVEVGCLDICPKRAVVVIAASRPRDWLVVPAGEDIASLASRLASETAPALLAVVAAKPRR